jgi:D-alanyl-D-alanine carboxypeptidase
MSSATKLEMMNAALVFLVLVLLLGADTGTRTPRRQGGVITPPELETSLFTAVPPEPAKTIEETLIYRTAAVPYPDKSTILKVEGDMILAHVNKTYALPSWYIPPNLVNLSDYVKTIGAMTLRSEVIPHLKSFLADAESACGCQIAVLSAYRSYQTQILAYGYWVAKVGQQNADLGSARPGHSEHQLGTTIDLTSSTVGYQLTRDLGYACEGIWLEANAHNYGFVLSYPQGKNEITGYIWEPWHFRWVGREAATEIRRQGITPEEYLSMR